uniref:Ribosomal protein S13 n=1 Tax=Prasinoderma coloniale TaxID=156133 RepID=V9PB93_9VIRI|nr:ribosomal protein S13 [Prasinoderma coloniale]AGW52223.1 ribosomal protein S13 [Prasinoderma coloniale]
MPTPTTTLLGQSFPSSTPLGHALRALYGIGHQSAKTYCAVLGVLPSLPLSALSKEHSMQLTALGEALYPGAYTLKRVHLRNLQTLVETSSYRGFRHRSGLPCRGQRTRSNARTPRRNNLLRKGVGR